MRGLWLLLIFVVCLFTGLAAECVAVWRAFGPTGLIISLACYLVAGLVADLACGMIFYTHRTFSFDPPKPRA